MKLCPRDARVHPGFGSTLRDLPSKPEKRFLNIADLYFSWRGRPSFVVRTTTMSNEIRIPELERAAHRRALRSARTHIAIWLAAVVMLILGVSALST